MFSFTPLSEKEAMESRHSLIEKGYYEAEIVKATHAVSKAGNDVMNLQIKIWDKNGAERIVFTSLVNHPSMIYKTLHLCEALGISDKYEKGTLSENDLSGKTINGYAHVIIKKGTEKPDGGMYPDKNDIEDFVKDDGRKKSDASKKGGEVVDEFDDEIPF